MPRKIDHKRVSFNAAFGISPAQLASSPSTPLRDPAYTPRTRTPPTTRSHRRRKPAND